MMRSNNGMSTNRKSVNASPRSTRRCLRSHPPFHAHISANGAAWDRPAHLLAQWRYLDAISAVFVRQFLEYLESEIVAGARTCDWSAAVKDYVAQFDAFASGSASVPPPAKAAPPPAAAPAAGGGFSFGGGSAAPTPPAFGAGAAAAPSCGAGGGLFGSCNSGAAAPSPFGAAAGLFGGGAVAAPAPAAPAPAPKSVLPAPAAAAESGADGDAEIKFSSVIKLSVYRQEKRNEEGELVTEKGWKVIGKGQLRIMLSEGVHFVEFRPEVSEGASNAEPEEEMVGKVRFGRPVLAAKLRPDTKFEVNKKSVQVNLWSADAAGKPVYARYNLPLGSEPAAEAFATTARSCVPPS